jgi:hypothetical protein
MNEDNEQVTEVGKERADEELFRIFRICYTLSLIVNVKHID